MGERPDARPRGDVRLGDHAEIVHDHSVVYRRIDDSDTGVDDAVRSDPGPTPEGSFSSTIAVIRPPSSRTIRPYPEGSIIRAVTIVAAAPRVSCASTSRCSVAARSNGTSPYSNTTLPEASARNGAAWSSA